MWAELSLVLSLFTRLTNEQTDGRTDRQSDISLMANTALDTMQRDKKWLGKTKLLETP